jgi:hypothetical protein
MIMPGRSLNSSSYRYGAANGQEKSTEINENSYTAEFWQYDARLVRRWNPDPVVKNYESPYAAFGNNPIWLSDVNGADTTLPAADGRNITLPTGATAETYQAGTSYTLNGKNVNVQAGQLRAFTLDGKRYQARWNESDLSFAGYQDDNGQSIVQANTFTPNLYDQYLHQPASLLSASLTYNSTVRVNSYLNPLFRETLPALQAGEIAANSASIRRFFYLKNTRSQLDPLGNLLSVGTKTEAQAVAQVEKFINNPAADASKIFKTNPYFSGAARFMKAAGPVLTVATEGFTYYTIVTQKPTIEQVEDMYTPGNPMLWMWRPIENYLKTLGPKK